MKWSTKIARPAKEFAAVSVEKVLPNSATRSAADTLPCLVQELGFLLKVYLLLVGEIDVGHLLIKNRDFSWKKANFAIFRGKSQISRYRDDHD